MRLRAAHPCQCVSRLTRETSAHFTLEFAAHNQTLRILCGLDHRHYIAALNAFVRIWLFWLDIRVGPFGFFGIEMMILCLKKRHRRLSSDWMRDGWESSRGKIYIIDICVYMIVDLLKDTLGLNVYFVCIK